jgi:type IV pilus assembly protein PilM
MHSIGHYDAIYSSLSSSLAIFKELKLPFIDEHKIRMVLEFEIEPLLPFSVHDAVIDFIVTKQLPQEKSSELLIAAVQKHHVAHHIGLFEQAGFSPNVITIDLFALYGVYRLIPTYAQFQGSTAIIDLGAQTTGIALIDNGQLRLIRALPKGVVHQAKALSHTLSMQLNDAMAALVRFGLEKNGNEEYTKAAMAIFSDFWQEIALTLNSFSAQTEQKQSINHIYILGGGAEIKGFSSFVTTLLGIECEPFQIHKLLQSNAVHFITKNGIVSTATLSICTALPTSTTARFNLRAKEFGISGDQTALTKQLIVASVLIALFFVTLAQQDFFQTRKLRNVARETQDEMIALLKQKFRKIPGTEEDLRRVVDMAEAELRKEEKLWFAFANPDRAAFLQYLLELTSRVNKQELQFTIDRLIITENSITLDAHVKDHDALIALENDLRQSKLFKHVDAQDQPDFKMKIRL